MNNSVTIRDYRTEIPGQLAPDRMVWTFPVVSTVTSHGSTSNWVINVRLLKNGTYIPIDDIYFDSVTAMSDITAEIKIDVGINGNINKNVPTLVISGKNIGRANATNVFTQALRDSLGMYNKKTRKVVTVKELKANTQNNIAQTNTDMVNINIRNGLENQDIQCMVPEMLPPMLAQVMKDLTTQPKCDAEHPLFVQPKYNGVRAVTTIECKLVDGAKVYRVIMYSRGKKEYGGFGYIKAELLDILKYYWNELTQLYFDGEIYSHGVALQDISGDARREDTAARHNYMIYDCFDAARPNWLYSERKKFLDGIFAVNNEKLKYCVPVPTYEVTNPANIDTHYREFLSQDFEGAMVRVNSAYKYSYNAYHSKELLKMKPSYDAELVITGWETGRKGKAAAALMIKCATADGIEFPVTPAMELDVRNALAAKMAEIEPNGKTHFENHWLGRKIIVTYDELSKNKVPQRARTEMIIRTWD